MSVSKSCLYNDCVSHPEADKTLTDGRLSYQYYYSRFYQPKNYRTKNKKKYIIGRKRGTAKTIFGRKSGTAMAGPAVPPTTALPIRYYTIPSDFKRYQYLRLQFLPWPILGTHFNVIKLGKFQNSPNQSNSTEYSFS